MHPVVVWTAIATICMCVCTCTGKGSACNVLIQTEGAYRIEGSLPLFMQYAQEIACQQI